MHEVGRPRKGQPVHVGLVACPRRLLQDQLIGPNAPDWRQDVQMAEEAVQVCNQESVASRVHSREVVDRVHQPHRYQPAKHIDYQGIAHDGAGAPRETRAGNHRNRATGGTSVEPANAPIRVLAKREHSRASAALDLLASKPYGVPGNHRCRERSPLVQPFEIIKHDSFGAASHGGLYVVEKQGPRSSGRAERGLVHLNADQIQRRLEV